MAHNWTENKRKLVILTGGIASGKSNVANDLKEIGAKIIDADVIAKEILGRRGEATSRVKIAFGDKMFSPQGDLIRGKLRRLVFHDMKTRQRLENIMMPIINREIMNRWMQDLETPITFVEAALFTDSTLFTRHPCLRGIWDQAFGIITVSADKEVRVKRVMKRDGVSYKEALQAVNCQRCDAVYPAGMQEWIINTEGSRDETRQQVQSIWEELQCQE